MTNIELKIWRQRLGLTQRQAAAQLGMSQSSYSAMERGVSYGRETSLVIDRRTELATQAVEYSLRRRGRATA